LRCAGFEDEAGRHLKNDGLHWFCAQCNLGASKLFQVIIKVQLRQDEMENELKAQKVEINELKGCMENNRRKTEEIYVKLQTAIEAKLVTVEAVEHEITNNVEAMTLKVNDSVRTIRKDVEESLELEKRKNSFIVHGMKEDDDDDRDWQKVKELLNDGLRMEADRHIEEVRRVGKTVKDKTRPLRVKIGTIEGKNEILRRANSLKEHAKYERVHISPDLTRKQQVIDKELRQKVKQYRQEAE
jgi:hypothetical protein